MLKFPLNDPARRWLEVIFTERFGHAWHLTRTPAGLRLQLAGAEGAILFDMLEDVFTQAHSDQPCTWWNGSREGWHSVLGGALPAPGVAELPAPLIEMRAGEHIIHYDIPGLTYWMLARVEEIGRTDLDNHERFPAASSHAYKHGYLDRPVVDEWLHVLGQVIQRQWPGVELKRHEFQMRVSHDVDRPSRYGFASPRNLIRRMAGDATRGDISSFLTAPWVRINTQKALHRLDLFNTFDWIMRQSEQQGLTSAFYFICSRSSRIDGEYDLEHPAMRDLLGRIYSRGHEIGLHPSYNAFKAPEVLLREADRLRRVCEEEGIQQDMMGGRMHYLRWQQPITMRAWADADMAYDSTLSYADHAGFRCGTCFEHPAFDAVGSESLAVRERPLIAMEASVLSQKYMGCAQANAEDVFRDLKGKCEKLSGSFTLLWHNSELTDRNSKSLYTSITSSSDWFFLY